MSETEPRWTKLDTGVLLAASALALVLGGYCFGREDHSTYLPMMWHIQDPTLFQGDLLIESAKHMHMYFWHVMAWLTMVLPTEPTFFVVHALVVVGTCIAAYGTSLTLFGNREAACLGLVLLLVPKGLFGLVEAGINSQPVLTQTNVAVCLLSFAIWTFLSGRYIIAFVLVGVAFNCQGMTACFVLAMFGAYVLWQMAPKRRHSERSASVARNLDAGEGEMPRCAQHDREGEGLDRPPLGMRRLALYALAFLLPALPTIIHVVAVESRTPPATAEDVQLWIKVMRLRMAHHVFPLSWPWDVWVRGALMLACFVVAFRRVTKSGPSAAEPPRTEEQPAPGADDARGKAARAPNGASADQDGGCSPHGKVTAFVIAVAALCLIGLVFSEWLPVLKVMQFQLWRSTRFVMYLGLLYLAADCAASRQGIQGLGSAAAIAATLVFPRGLPFSAPLLVLYLTSRPRHQSLLFGLIAVVAVWIGARIRSGGDPLAMAMVWGASAWILATVLAAPLSAPERTGYRQWQRSALLVWALLLAVARLGLDYVRHGGFSLNPLPGQGAWLSAQLHARDATSKDATFLVPIHRDSFRCRSRRAIVCDYKDAGPHMYCVGALKAWDQRMSDMGLWSCGAPQQAYAALGWDRLRTIARKYSAGYVIAERELAGAPAPLRVGPKTSPPGAMKEAFVYTVRRSK